MKILLYLIVIVGVIYFFTGSDDMGGCLTGLIVMAVGIGITIFAFSFNPILGIIVGVIVLQGWKNMNK